MTTKSDLLAQALRPDCALSFEQDFLSPEQAERLQQTLRDELVWEQREVVIFGRRVPQPRLIAWAGEVPYRYSGLTLQPRPLSAELGGVLAEINRVSSLEFNHLLLNRYRDGADSMGWHSDDETELGPEPQVATLSLGAARRFLIKPRRGARGSSRLEYVLTSGSLLLMLGAFQRHYSHAVPKQRTVAGERISITFRRVLRAG